MQTAQQTWNQPIGGGGLTGPVHAEARRDLLLTVLFCALAYASAASLIVLEPLVTYGGEWRINEIAAVLAILIAGLGVCSLIRWKALKAAALRRSGARG